MRNSFGCVFEITGYAFVLVGNSNCYDKKRVSLQTNCHIF